MIVLCGIPSEEPLQAVIEAAEERGTDYVVFNQRAAQFCDMTLHVCDGHVGGTLRINETDIDLDAIRGVFVRLMDHRDIPENEPLGKWSAVSPEAERSDVLHTTLAEWLEITPCRVLNRAGSSASNMSKPYQAQWIRRAGFAVPETLVSSDPERVREFARHHGRVIYKSTSSVRSIVMELDDERMDELDQVCGLPTQFQQYVPGVDIRVHTVGQRIFATEVQSDATDYRYAHRQGGSSTLTSYELPDSVAQQCIELSGLLDLPLAGIDLRRTPEGVFYCFEVNPSPAYTYYQAHTDQPIAEAIVDYLVDGD